MVSSKLSPYSGYPNEKPLSIQIQTILSMMFFLHRVRVNQESVSTSFQFHITTTHTILQNIRINCVFVLLSIYTQPEGFISANHLAANWSLWNRCCIPGWKG